ncbi:hypothetical protein BX666DRAFT_1879683 [Dichotomocladium elegans]|nr:hypothetical protein BX666DRAFT_1879683 [Dichotomocladium elegans]
MDYSEYHARENAGGVNHTVLGFLSGLTLPQALDTITEFLRNNNVKVHVADENWHTAYLGFNLDTIGVNRQIQVKVAHEPLEVAEDVLVHEFAPPSPASVEDVQLATLVDPTEVDRLTVTSSRVDHPPPETPVEDPSTEDEDYQPPRSRPTKRRNIEAPKPTEEPITRALVNTGAFPKAVSNALVDIQRVAAVMALLTSGREQEAETLLYNPTINNQQKGFSDGLVLWRDVAPTLQHPTLHGPLEKLIADAESLN